MKRNITLIGIITVVVLAVVFLLYTQGHQNPATSTISGTRELVLNEQDLQVLEITNNGTYCRSEEYNTSEFSPLAQYSICSYTINSLNDTQVILELKKYTNFVDLNGTYQYESLHLRSVEGLISQNDYGDQSRFYINNVNDYGGNLTDASISYYALYITKDGYIIYISSKGSKEAGEYIAKIGRQILSKF